MNLEEEAQFIFQGRSKETDMGCVTEWQIEYLLKNMPFVEEVYVNYIRGHPIWDIFFRLRGENVIRGLQVKSITKKKDKLGGHYDDLFNMSKISKYPVGTLIVGFNLELQLGLLFFQNEETFKEGSKRNGGTLSTKENSKGIFAKYMYYRTKFHNDFCRDLQNMLSRTTVIDLNSYLLSLKNNGNLLKEATSLVRFANVLDTFILRHSLVRNDSSPTDMVVNGYKVQFKYVSEKNKSDGYSVHLQRREGYKTGGEGNKVANMVSYIKGENDYYIIELGKNEGQFLIIPEWKALELGLLRTSEKPKAKLSFTVRIRNHPRNSRANNQWLNEDIFWTSCSNIGGLINLK